MKIKVNGTHLFYETEGSGADSKKPTLLLLHGGPGADHSMFKPYFSRFADVAQIIYLDLRGHGRSDPCSSDHWNLSTWADDVKLICDALAIKNLIVYGHSVGGMVATSLALRHPNAVKKLVLSHTFARFNLPVILDRFEKIGCTKAKVAAEMFWTNPSNEHLDNFSLNASPFYCQRWPADILEITARAINRHEIAIYFWKHEGIKYDARDSLKDIICNTLVLGGNKDPVSGIEDINELCSGIQSDLVQSLIIEDCGHFPWWDAPEKTSEIIHKFIATDSKMRKA